MTDPPAEAPRGRSEEAASIAEAALAVPAIGRGRAAYPRDSTRRAFGHAHDRRQIVEEEADAIRDAARRVLGGDTLSSIVRSWNERGLRTANGGPWRVNSFSTLLLQPRLAGLGKDGEPLPKGMFPAILDADTHAQLVAIHKSRRKRSRRPSRRYLLTGLLRCGRCGGNLRGFPRSRGSDLYVCPGPPHGGCSGTAVTADHAEQVVRELLFDRLDNADLIAATSDRTNSAEDDRERHVALERDKHQDRLAELAEMWASGEITRVEWLSLKRAVDRQAREGEADVVLLQRRDALRRLVGKGAAVRSGWSNMTHEERRALLYAALERVDVLPATPPRRPSGPERLRPVWVELR